MLEIFADIGLIVCAVAAIVLIIYIVMCIYCFIKSYADFREWRKAEKGYKGILIYLSEEQITSYKKWLETVWLERKTNDK